MKMRGAHIAGEWYLKTIELETACPWCVDKKPVETLEFGAVVPVNGLFKIRDIGALVRERESTLPVAYFSHFNCGPDWIYWVNLKRVNVEWWKKHIRTKGWCESIFLDAISLAATINERPIATKSARPLQTYFIQSESGHVKIGRSHNPLARLKSLQTGRHDRLKIVKIIKNDVETQLHQRFAHLRESGEWFRCDKELADFLEQELS
jgi:hypothetical protein